MSFLAIIQYSYMIRRTLKCSYLMCLLLVISNQAFAQHQQSVVFGLEIGAGLSTLSYDTPRNDWEESGRASFNGMAFAIIPLFNPLYLQAGLRLHNVGNDVDFELIDDGDVVNGSNQITQNYFSVPVRLHIALGKDGLYLMGGIEAGYLLSATITQRIEPNLNSQEASITSTLNRLNFSALGGVGYLFELTSGQMYFQGQFSRGITGVADNSGDFTWFSDWVTQDITLSVGLIF